MTDIFRIRQPIQIKDIHELDLKSLLNSTYTITSIECNKGINVEGKLVVEQVRYFALISNQLIGPYFTIHTSCF